MKTKRRHLKMLIIIKYTQYTKIQTYTPNREHLSGFKGTFVTQRAEKEENPKSLTLRGLSTSRGLSHRA